MLSRYQAEVWGKTLLIAHNGRIHYAGPYKENLAKQCRVLRSAPGCVALPGLINAHTHLAMTLFRGARDDAALASWLFEAILPLEGKFVSPDFVKVGTELAALECIRFGTTTAIDMYFFVETAARVWDQAGLRGQFSQPMVSGPLPEDKWLGSDKEKILRRFAESVKSHPRITAAAGPHAPYTCNDETLRLAQRLSQELQLPLHIHVAETEQEELDSLKQHKMTSLERLQKLGLIHERTQVAHGVHLSPKDIETLKKSKASVVHNPDSNTKLASGVAPVVAMNQLGLTLGLGTDGAASANDLSLFGAMDLSCKLQKVFRKDAQVQSAYEALWMATRGGAAVLGREHELGVLKEGALADFILVDLNQPHLQPVYDTISQLVYCANGSEVRHVVCHGKELLRDGKYLTLDSAAIFKRVSAWQKKLKRELAPKLWAAQGSFSDSLLRGDSSNSARGVA